MDFLFGADMPLAVRFFLAFIIVLALIGGTAFLVRRFGGERLGSAAARGRQPRLAVIDAAAVDGRRRLILIRRDNVEHLLMIGGPSDIVVEVNIVRANAPGRDAGGPRPAAAPGDNLPKALPLNDDHMWPLQPETAPAPRPARPIEEPAAPWPAEPEMPLPTRRPEPRPEPRAEPRMDMRQDSRQDMRQDSRQDSRQDLRAEMRQELRPEMRLEPRSEARPEPRPEPRAPADPLAGLAAELSRVQPERTPASDAAARPRPPRERPRAPAPERVAARPAGGSDDALTANADQNLAEMAQRLEAALRRPRGSESRAPEAAPRASIAGAAEPMPEAVPVPMGGEAVHAEPPASPATPAAPRGGAAKPAAQKSVYDSLEQEMASLLGRPNAKT